MAHMQENATVCMASSSFWPTLQSLTSEEGLQEYMQVSLGQLAGIARLGIDLFAQLRSFNAAFLAEVIDYCQVGNTTAGLLINVALFHLLVFEIFLDSHCR